MNCEFHLYQKAIFSASDLQTNLYSNESWISIIIEANYQLKFLVFQLRYLLFQNHSRHTQHINFFLINETKLLLKSQGKKVCFLVKMSRNYYSEKRRQTFCFLNPGSKKS